MREIKVICMNYLIIHPGKRKQEQYFQTQIKTGRLANLTSRSKYHCHDLEKISYLMEIEWLNLLTRNK